MSHRYIIDFYPGSHGHFLEYAINTWIFGGPKVQNIFTDIGTCHGTYNDNRYMLSKRVLCGHFSETKRPIPVECEKIIRISVSSFFEQCCLQINATNRAGDIPRAHKELKLSDSVLNDPVQLRNIYFSRFVDAEHQLSSSIQWCNTQCSVLEINMSDLYNLLDFFAALQRIAAFLTRQFKPDNDIIAVWQKFMSLNHGVCSWNKANQFVTATILQMPYEDNLNIEEQALVNVLLSQTMNIYSGELFDSIEYPTNTLDAYRILNK